MTIRAARTDIGVAKGLATLNHTTDSTSVVFDCAPWTGVVVALNIYTSVDSGGDCVLYLQDSPDGSSDWQNVPGMVYTMPAVSSSQTAASWVFLTDQVRRYVRIFSDVPSSSSWVGGAQIIGHEPKGNRPSGFDFALDGATAIS